VRLAPLDDGRPAAQVILVAVGEQHNRESLGYPRWFYPGSALPVLQCVWPDKAGRFPWEPD